MANLKMKLTGDWDLIEKTFKKGKIRTVVKKAVTKGLMQCGEEVKKNMIGILRSGRAGGPKLHPFTVARKGRKKKLIDTGALARAIKVFVDSKKNVFVGIKAGKKSSKGQDLALIANIHENGMTQKVTPKMRAFLHHQGFHLRKSTKVLRTPARPFIAPAVAKSEKKCVSAVAGSLKKEMEQLLRKKVIIEVT